MNDTELGYELTAIAAGIDEFERRSSRGGGILEDEGFIPLYLGDGLVVRREYAGWPQVEADLARAREAVALLEDGPRRDFLAKLMESLAAAAALFQGRELGYEEKLSRLVGLPAEPVDPVLLASLEGLLREGLSKAGFGKGSLRERIAAWEAKGAIPPGELPRAFAELQLEAKARTDELIVDTGDYLMELNPVRGAHFTARCDFSGRKMDLNVENSFTRTSMKHLVTHEIFPGHATQNIYTVGAYERGAASADVLLCSLNGVPGVIQEGIGDQGLELIGWVEDLDDEIGAALTRYRSAVATQAAWMINVEGLGDAAAAEYLREAGAMQEARIRGRIAMSRHPYRGPFVASYFHGNEAVRRVRLAVEKDPARRAAFIADLYGRMHSPESLRRSNGVPPRARGEG